MRLELDPGCTIAWQPIDDHGTHAMIVDDFLREPEALRELALSLGYAVPAHPDHYPGYKAYASLAGAADVKRWIADQVLDHLYPDGRPDLFRTDQYDAQGAFSVFACDRAAPPRDLEDQHTDGFAWLAAVLHLSHAVADRGTAMWEHRPTRLQQWLATDPMRMHALERRLGLRLGVQLQRLAGTVPIASNGDVVRLFRPAPGRRPFTAVEDDQWRLLAYVPARFNRLVVYPTWQIHSVVDASAVDAPGIEDARLTFNLMVEYPFDRSLTRARTCYPDDFYRPVRGLPR